MPAVVLKCLYILYTQEPNPDDPLDNKVAEVWKNDLKLAHKNAREWTKIYAV